ncbi:MAG: NUDIX hydrolase [Parachlamydiales bacterium]|nr:NUDIX hydrolase [Parachlamydiales bacterium]
MKILLFFATAIYAGQISYLDVLERLGSSFGDHNKGEIEIVAEPEHIEKIETFQKQQLMQKGYSEKEAASFSKVGIVAQDQYWIWIRDAVVFPNGTPGTYDRLVWKNQLHSPHAGVAVLPIMPDGKIALNLNYRHATRSWELEIPRGMIKMGETGEQAALREMKEETGLTPSSIEYLGEMAPDSGTIGTIVPIYIAYGSQEGLSNIEYSEAIAGNLAYPIEEIQKGFSQGYLMVNGEKIPMRDPFLAFALLKRELLQK